MLLGGWLVSKRAQSHFQDMEFQKKTIILAWGNAKQTVDAKGGTVNFIWFKHSRKQKTVQVTLHEFANVWHYIQTFTYLPS